jgi:hypothetical protein
MKTLTFKSASTICVAAPMLAGSTMVGRGSKAQGVRGAKTKLAKCALDGGAM